jgi:Flp pilus assembly protein TadB
VVNPPPPPPVYRSRGPSAAQIAAARRAEQARVRAAKLREQRARQAAMRAKAKRLEEARARQQALHDARERRREKAEAEQRRKEAAATLAANGDSNGSAASPASGIAGDGGSSSSNMAPFVGVVFLLALVVLTLGLVPAYLVPWYRLSIVLEEYGRQFALAGGMAVLATGLFFLMVVSGG